MVHLRFFQLVLIAGVLFLSSCWNGRFAGNAETAPNNHDLDVWNEGEIIPASHQPNIWDIAKRHGSFTMFAQLVEIAELEETFKFDQDITVLAPTDEAFNQLPEGIIKQLVEKENAPLLVDLLLDHVIPDMYLSTDLLDGEKAPTLSGNHLIISRDADIRLGNATVTTADINASNGVVHVVDQVILTE